MHRTSLVVVLVSLLSRPAAAQGSASAPGCGWDTRCSTAGATLAAVEVERTSQPKRGTVVTYRLNASGLPAGPAYTLWMRRVDGKEQWIVAGYASDSAAGLRCADRADHPDLAKQAGDGWCPMPIDSIALAFASMVPGESVDFALRSQDGATAAYARVVPHPVEAKADGCVLSSRVVGTSFRSVAISGSGFVAGEQVRTVSVSGEESIAGTETVSPDGTMLVMMLPAAKGAARGGEATYEVAGSRCTVKLNYKWGKALKPI